jgi:phosphoglycolate phosphatase-like HAD superfamily hydrolase
MKLAIFDIDGTLTNTNSVDDECFVRAFSEVHGITDLDTDWAAYPHTTDSGITLQVLQQKFGRDPEAAELDKFKVRFVKMLTAQHEADSSGFAEIAGASSALNLLRRDSGWAVAIATGCWRESASLKLTAARIETNGLPAAYAEDGISREDILKTAVSQSLAQYQVSGFERIVSVGDGLWDVRTAARLNFAFLGVGNGESAAKLRQAGAKHVIADFSDFGRLVTFLNEAEVPNPEYFGNCAERRDADSTQ